MVLKGAYFGFACGVCILAGRTCAVIAILKLNPRLRFSVMAVSSGVGLATLAWAGHGAMDDGVRGYIHLASDVMHLWAAGAWIGALVAFFMLAVIKDRQSVV